MPRTLRTYAHRESRDQLLARAATQALTLYWLSDTHVSATVGEDPNAPVAQTGQKMFWQAPAKCRHFVAQVHADQPHAVVHTGDCVESAGYPDGFTYFRSFWDTIDAGIPKMFVPGNHDYATDPETAQTIMQTIADGMGFGSAPLIAGSRMNRTVTVTGNGVSAKFILLDVGTGHEADPIYSHGSLHAGMLDWISAELANSTQDLIFLASHEGPHDWPLGFFRQSDAYDLASVVAAEVAARPGRRITHLFGHNHLNYGIREYSNLGPGYRALLGPALLEGNLQWFAVQPGDTSWFTKLHIFPTGQIVWERSPAIYPHV